MTDVSPRFRPVLDTVPAYKPGQVPIVAAGQAHKLSSNESPYGPLPSVLRVIAEAAREANRYPDNGAGALTAAIAESLRRPRWPRRCRLRVGRRGQAAHGGGERPG